MKIKQIFSVFFVLLFALSLIAQKESSHIPVEWLERNTTLAVDIFNQSQPLQAWQEENITIFGHYLLAVKSQASADSIFSNWLSGKIKQKDIQKFHRGEFLSILSEFNCAPKDSIIFDDGTTILVADIIDYEKQIFTISENNFFNQKEEYYGQEYGWLLKGFSYFLKSSDEINKEFKISNLANHIISLGINRNYEEGCHDLEALARVLKVLKKDSSQFKDDIKNIEDYLWKIANHELEHIGDNGQAYRYSRRFDGSILRCKTKFCTTLDNLNRQAHLIEWLAEAEFLEQISKTAIILKRFEQLLIEANTVINERLRENSNQLQHSDILIISSLSHAINALARLASLN